MTTPSKFSVVTPCYNSERYIAETLESVLSQRGPFTLQYILVDGGSTDNTLSVIHKYKARVESGCYSGNCVGVEFIVISEPDRGMYDAISKGFQLVNGDICCYINSDDFYLPNAFRTALAFFSFYKGRINWLTGIPNIYNSFGANVKRNLPFKYRADFIRKGVYGREMSHIQQESIFWRSGMNQVIDWKRLASYKFAGDFYLWHEFSKTNKLWIIDSILSGFRMHETNKSKGLEFYQQEFESIVSGRLSFFDKIMVAIHRRLWTIGYHSKRKYSDSILSGFNPKLQQHYLKLEREILGIAKW
jgi:glycosyltransferase involved in cell wall biosynthesis